MARCSVRLSSMVFFKLVSLREVHPRACTDQSGSAVAWGGVGGDVCEASQLDGCAGVSRFRDG